MRDDPTAIVVHSQFPVQKRQAELDPTRKKFFFVTPGTLIYGWRFSIILITRDAAVEMFQPEYSSKPYCENAEWWYRDHLLTRLNRDGVVVNI